MSKKTANKKAITYLIIGIVLIIGILIFNDEYISYTALNIIVYILIGAVVVVIAKLVDRKLQEKK